MKGYGSHALFTPIRRRLVAWTMLILGAILVLLGACVYVTMSRSLIGQVDRNLVGHGPGRPPDHEGYRGGAFTLAFGADGRVLANPQQVQVAGAAWPAPPSGHAGVLATVSVDDQPTRVFVQRGPDGGTLVIGQSLEPEAAAMQALLFVLIGGGGLGLLLSLAGAWFLSGRALVPIQRAFQRQQEFVADASHELRTPLTVLKSATDLLDAYRADRLGDHADLLDDVRAEIQRMQHLTEDLLTLARSDRGQLELMTAPVDLASLAADVVRRATPLASSRSQTLVFVPPSTGASVEVDPERIQQVLLILLDNALKYTPEGGRIDIDIDVDVRGGGGRHAIPEVTDTGPGIPAEHLPRLFDRFYRADAARSRAAGGAGLGLAIARMLVEAHGGELSLASAPGAGTRATVRLPLAEPAAAPSVSRLGQLAGHLMRAA